LLDTYKKAFSKFLGEAKDLKQKIYETYSGFKQSEPQPEITINSSILREPLSPNLSDLKNYDSILVKCSASLVEELKAEQHQFLSKILNNPKRIELIFRGSEHEFKAEAFHERCDGITDTLTLVRTEFGKTIGGFTNYAWDSSNTYVTDLDSRIFLFSLDLKEKYIPVKHDQLMYRRST
jgi:hypothetical protein